MSGIVTGVAALMMSALMPQPAETIAGVTAPETEEATTSLGTARDRISRMTVGVMINGKGPFDFVVDTAAERTVISARLAAELGLPAGKALHVQGASGAGVVPSVVIAKLGVGSRRITDVEAPVLDEQALGAVGLLGIDALAEQRVVMDFKAEQLTVHTPPRRTVEDDDVIVVSAKRRFGQLIMADASVHSDKVYAIVDSGAEVSIGNSALRERLFRGKHPPVAIRTTLIGVTGESMPADFVVITEMRIGTMKIYNVPVAFADIPPFAMFKLTSSPAMLLGTDLLRGFERVSLDFETKKVRFLPKSTERLVGPEGMFQR